MEKNNKIRKKVLKTVSIGLGIFGIIFLLKRNRELSGIIKNQQITIDGLMREVKNLSYHLGKKTKFN